MQAKILSIHRQCERLMTFEEVASRLGVNIVVARQILRAHGLRPSGKNRGRLYITEERLHRALREMKSWT